MPTLKFITKNGAEKVADDKLGCPQRRLIQAVELKQLCGSAKSAAGKEKLAGPVSSAYSYQYNNPPTHKAIKAFKDIFVKDFYPCLKRKKT